MAASNFLACFNETESFEGGYVDNPHDPGGATLKGVTQAVYTAWLLSQHRAGAPVRNASDADIQAIYRAQYWDAVRGNDLYVGLDLVMVDYGWGSGPVTAIKKLQSLIGADVDGHFGILTMDALKAYENSPDLINRLCAARLSFFQSLATWKYFDVGWTNRLNGMHAKALEMNAAARAAIAKA
jgi:lysozyme family protein